MLRGINTFFWMKIARSNQTRPSGEVWLIFKFSLN